MNPTGTHVNGVNLLSAQRKARTRRRLLARRWGGGLAMYAFVLCGATLAVTLSTRAGASIESELATAATQLERAQAELALLQNQKLEMHKRVSAARAVGYHADWSILMRLLAQLRGQSVVFDDITLEHRVEATTRERPGAGDRKPTAATRREWYELTLLGVADDVRSVNEFVMGLEESGLFERVRRGESTQADARGTHFRLICEMRDQPQPTPEEKQP